MLERASAPRASPKPRLRTCVGCRQADTPEALVRVVLTPDGEVVVDLAGGAFGRGAWLHARPGCLQAAAPRGLSKSFKAEIRTQAPSLAAALGEAANRRIRSLLSGASGARKLAIGSDAVERALGAGEAHLVVVASDARAAADSARVRAAIAEGRAIAWGTKELLGTALDRGETGVVAVLDGGLAQALHRAAQLLLVNLTDSKREVR